MDFLDALSSFNRPKPLSKKSTLPVKTKKTVSQPPKKKDTQKKRSKDDFSSESESEDEKPVKKLKVKIDKTEEEQEIKKEEKKVEQKQNDPKVSEDDAVFKSPLSIRSNSNLSFLEETPNSESLNFDDFSVSDASLSVNKKPRKTANQSKLPTSLTKIMVDGITRKQRHNVLNLLNTAVERYKTKVDPCFVYDKEAIVDYMVRLENRVYNSIFLRVMRPCFNMYRYNLYRKTTHELIWSLRRNAKRLLTFPPDLLASLPPKELIRESECAIWYEQYVERQKEIKRREQEVREAKKQIVPEGNFLRCPKCHCLMVMRELQTRKSDEPMSIFRTCQNCGFTKRN